MSFPIEVKSGEWVLAFNPRWSRPRDAQGAQWHLICLMLGKEEHINRVIANLDIVFEIYRVSSRRGATYIDGEGLKHHADCVVHCSKTESTIQIKLATVCAALAAASSKVADDDFKSRVRQEDRARSKISSLFPALDVASMTPANGRSVQ